MNKKNFYSALVQWLPFVVVIVIFTGMVNLAVQQNYRMSANDPQIQIAQDVVSAINQGQPVGGIVPAVGTTEMATTLSPFLMIFNSSDALVGSSVIINGKNPSLPSSIFDYAKMHGQDRLTWQPQSGVREAIVVVPYTGQQGGFVVAGRSLKEIEIRENQLNVITAVGGLTALLLSYIVIFILIYMANRNDTPGDMPDGEVIVEVTETVI